jgi:hypothetical protein
MSMKLNHLNRINGCWRQWNWLVAACFLATKTPRALALDPAEKPANYVVAHWDTDDGLPHNEVRCIIQTHMNVVRFLFWIHFAMIRLRMFFLIEHFA